MIGGCAVVAPPTAGARRVGAPYFASTLSIDMPLDGLWLRAPYLHNGSVPDLRALLERMRDEQGRLLRKHG